MNSKRKLRRFFSSQKLPKPGQRIVLSKDETHHLKDILRLQIGEACLVTDGTGIEAEAEIREFLKDGRANLEIKTCHDTVRSDGQIHLTMIQALSKKGTIDTLVEKAQELGVDEFWPVETERSVIRLSKENRSKTLERWKKKSIEAAKQSGSLNLVQIHEASPFQKALEAVPKKDKIIVFHPDSQARPFREWVETLKGAPKSLSWALCLGPEGGFSPKEIVLIHNMKQEQGRDIEFVSLGDSILRVETAFIGIVATVRFLFS